MGAGGTSTAMLHNTRPTGPKLMLDLSVCRPVRATSRSLAAAVRAGPGADLGADVKQRGHHPSRAVAVPQPKHGSVSIR